MADRTGIAITIVVAFLVAAVGVTMWFSIGSPEEFRTGVCQTVHGEGATAINIDSPEIDCQLENGTIVEDVRVPGGTGPFLMSDPNDVFLLVGIFGAILFVIHRFGREPSTKE